MAFLGTILSIVSGSVYSLVCSMRSCILIEICYASFSSPLEIKLGLRLSSPSRVRARLDIGRPAHLQHAHVAMVGRIKCSWTTCPWR
jgi:hypothetical protein